jgi:hypothetical protein
VLGCSMHLLLVGLSSFCVHSPTPGNQPDFDAEKTSGSFTSRLARLTQPWKRSRHGSETSVLNHFVVSDA